MSEGTTGQPVEVPAEAPGSSTVPAQESRPAKSSGTGRSSSGDAGDREARDPDAGPGPEATDRPVGEDAAREGSAAGQGGGDGANRRRRGSRGGRGRSRSGAPVGLVGPDGDESPSATRSVATTDDGSPGPGGGPATVPPRGVPERPKIGDSRPARPPAGAVEAPPVGRGSGDGGRPGGSGGATRAGPEVEVGPARRADRPRSPRAGPRPPGSAPVRPTGGPRRAGSRGPRPGPGPRAAEGEGSGGARPSAAT